MRASSSRAHAERRKKYDRPSRAPMAYAVMAPRTLPDSAAADTAGSDIDPRPARKKANSMVESPGDGGKTYSSQARRTTRKRPDEAWAAMAFWIASLMERSDLLDQIAQERDRPALAAHGLDDADDRHGQVQQDEVDQTEGEQPRKDAVDGGEDRAHEDDQ